MSKTELTQRATVALHATQLAFSCYRIRRRFALSLPVTALPELQVQVRAFNQAYPLQIWCLWELEERLHALGGAADWVRDRQARQQCAPQVPQLGA